MYGLVIRDFQTMRGIIWLKPILRLNPRNNPRCFAARMQSLRP